MSRTVAPNDWNGHVKVSKRPLVASRWIFQQHEWTFTGSPGEKSRLTRIFPVDLRVEMGVGSARGWSQDERLKGSHLGCQHLDLHATLLEGFFGRRLAHIGLPDHVVCFLKKEEITQWTLSEIPRIKIDMPCGNGGCNDQLTAPKVSNIVVWLRVHLLNWIWN